MLAQFMDTPGPWHDGGPGWWIVFPILFWTVVAAVIGYLVYRHSPRRAARAAAERTLADRYARGEIDGGELKRLRDGLR